MRMRVTSNFLKSIDNWRKQQLDGPSRTEAIRRLVEHALAHPPKKKR